VPQDFNITYKLDYFDSEPANVIKALFDVNGNEISKNVDKTDRYQSAILSAITSAYSDSVVTGLAVSLPTPEGFFSVSGTVTAPKQELLVFNPDGSIPRNAQGLITIPSPYVPPNDATKADLLGMKLPGTIYQGLDSFVTKTLADQKAEAETEIKNTTCGSTCTTLYNVLVNNGLPSYEDIGKLNSYLELVLGQNPSPPTALTSNYPSLSSSAKQDISAAIENVAKLPSDTRQAGLASLKKAISALEVLMGATATDAATKKKFSNSATLAFAKVADRAKVNLTLVEPNKNRFENQIKELFESLISFSTVKKVDLRLNSTSGVRRAADYYLEADIAYDVECPSDTDCSSLSSAERSTLSTFVDNEYTNFAAVTTTTSAPLESSGDGGGSSSMMPIIIVVVVVVILIVIAAVVVIQKKKQKMATDEPKNGNTMVAFENPMYEASDASRSEPTYSDPAYSDVPPSGEGLYDEPAFSQGGMVNPMYDDEEPMYHEPKFALGGNFEEHDEGGYLDVAPDLDGEEDI
jgi:hypothetical protein